MGIRRRRRKLTTLVSRLDQRLRSVELKPISLLTAAQVAAAVEEGAASELPEVLVSGAAPYEWLRVQDAYYYPAKLASNTEDRVEIYLEADLDNLDRGGRLAVSGIHGTSSFDIDVDGDNFTVLHLDAVDEGGVWDNRASWKHDPLDDQLSGVTITNTYSFKPETLGPVTWTTRQRLQTKRQVDSFEITGTTVTLTMNATHKFEVGDIFYTNILSDQASNDESRVASGIDGLFYITAVTDTTIEYELTAGVDTPTGTITPTADVYVFPVARRWAQTGSIWVNSSDNTTYYWDGIRWVEYTADTAVTQDDDPPSPPTGLTIESDISLPRNIVVVDVSWTAPTTNESGSSLTDLAGHEIQWRTGPTAQWNTHFVPINLGNTYTFNSGEFAPEQLYYFQVFAVDSGDNFSSTALTGTHTTAGDSSTTNIGAVRPTPPDVETYLGTFTITWDGDVEDTSNVVQSDPPGVAFLYIHASTSDGFTPSESTRVGTLAAGPNQKFVYHPQNYTDTWYFRLEIEDRAGSGSLFSRQATGTGQSLFDAERLSGMIAAANIVPNTIVSGETIVGINIGGEFIIGDEINGNLITANSINAIQIDAGTITAKLSQGDVITTSPTDSGSRIRITKDYLEAYNNTTLNFRLTAANGHVYIGDSVQIGGDYVTTSDLSGYATTGQLAGKIDNGGAASDINSNATTINGGKITTGTLLANTIGSGTLPVGVVYAGEISATQVTAGTFTGSSFRTAESNRRVLISSSSNSIKFYDDGDGDLAQRGTIIGTLSQMRIYGPSNNIYQTMSSTTYQLSVNSGTLITANSTSFVLQSGGSSALDIGSTYSLLRSPSSSTQIYMDSTSILFDGVVSAGSPAYVFQGGSDTLRVEDLGGTTASTISAFASGTLYRGTGSDERLKENILDMSNSLGLVKSSRPVTFTYKPDVGFGVGTHYGLIAQELATILPEENTVIGTTKIEGEDDTDYYTIEYQRLIPILMGAVKELSAQVDSLTSKIEALET